MHPAPPQAANTSYAASNSLARLTRRTRIALTGLCTDDVAAALAGCPSAAPPPVPYFPAPWGPWGAGPAGKYLGGGGGQGRPAGALALAARGRVGQTEGGQGGGPGGRGPWAWPDVFATRRLLAVRHDASSSGGGGGGGGGGRQLARPPAGALQASSHSSCGVHGGVHETEGGGGDGGGARGRDVLRALAAGCGAALASWGPMYPATHTFARSTHAHACMHAHAHTPSCPCCPRGAAVLARLGRSA